MADVEKKDLPVEDVEEEEKDEEIEDEEEGEAGTGAGGRANRAEKKARKAIAKLGLKQVPGAAKVIVKKQKQVLFVVNNPDVYKNASGDSYVIFGEAKVEDPGASAQAEAARQFAGRGAGGADPAAMAAMMKAMSGAAAGGAAGLEDDAAADSGADAAASASGSADGVEEKDIKLVMDQANCKREDAIKALKKNNSDIVSAIMELTM